MPPKKTVEKKTETKRTKKTVTKTVTTTTTKTKTVVAMKTEKKSRATTKPTSQKGGKRKQKEAPSPAVVAAVTQVISPASASVGVDPQQMQPMTRRRSPFQVVDITRQMPGAVQNASGLWYVSNYANGLDRTRRY